MTPLHRNHRETFPDFASAASGLRVLPVLRQQRRHDFRVGAEIGLEAAKAAPRSTNPRRAAIKNAQGSVMANPC
jgi:hypothetical protein